MNNVENLAKREEELKNTLENSLPGTLAYNESKFYLSIIQSIKKIEKSELKKKDLENIAGGTRFTNRLLASLTAFTGLLSANPEILAQNANPTGQSNVVTSYKKSQADEYEEIIRKVNDMSYEELHENLERLEKKYEKLCNSNIQIMSYLLGYYNQRFARDNRFTTYVYGEPNLYQNVAAYMHFDAFVQKHPEYFDNETSSFKVSEFLYVQELSDEDVMKNIKEETEKLKKMGSLGKSEYFKTEKDLENSINPRVLLLTLRKINKTFEKYSKLTNKMVKILKKEKATFKIHSFNSGHNNEVRQNHKDSVMCTDYCYRTSHHNRERLFNIFLSKNSLNNINEIFTKSILHRISGFSSYVEGSELISGIVAHEMGHVFEFLMVKLAWGLGATSASWNASHDCIGDINQPSSSFYRHFISKIKEKIIKIAKEKYGAVDSDISEYAKTSDLEWFAEVFANLECSDEENISPYGKAMRDVIKIFEKDKIILRDIKDFVPKIN